MTELDFYEINQNIILSEKLMEKLNFTENDTFYVFASDFVNSTINISDKEKDISLKLMSLLKINLDDEEDFLITGKPQDLYLLLIRCIRFILKNSTISDNTENK